MSTQVTEAHRKLAADLCRHATGSNRALHHVPKFAQLIADSESKAISSLAMVAGGSADRNVSLRLENDQLRAEVERLRAGIAECLRTNGHLADGEDCTLIGLKRCLRSDLALRRYTKQQVIEFAKKNVATNDYAFGERSGGYIITESKDNISKQK